MPDVAPIASRRRKSVAQCSLQFGPAFHPRDFNRERLEQPAAQFDELASARPDTPELRG